MGVQGGEPHRERARLVPHSVPHSGARRGAPFKPMDTDQAAKVHFQRDMRNASEDAIDLLIHLLHFDPEKRMTANEALAHSYIAQFHDPSVERTSTVKVQPQIPDDEKKSTNHYREALYTQSTKKFSAMRQGSRRQQAGEPASGRSQW